MVIVIVMVIVVAMIVVVAMVVTEAVAVSIAVMIPPMIMFKPAAIAFPVSLKILPTLVTRAYPSSTFIGWPGPIPIVPPVMMTDRVPVAVDPHKFRTRTRG